MSEFQNESLSSTNHKMINQAIKRVKSGIELKGVNNHGLHVQTAYEVANNFNLTDTEQVAHIIAYLLIDTASYQ